MPPKAAMRVPGPRSPGSPTKIKPATPFAVKSIGAFYIFLFVNIIAALYAPIQDCDETFNYWEPTHYISHGHGLETWEYSPEYAIRSWTYVALHAIAGGLRRLWSSHSKVAEFYFIRYVLAFICALCQTQLFRVINTTLNPRIGIYFIMAMVSSPGMFHASAAFLPSSFAMYTTMLGMAAFMNWKGGLKTLQGICWFALGGVLGWPFSVALSAPFLFEEVVFAALSSKDAFLEAIMRFLRGFVATLLILLFEFLISGFFYKKAVVVPMNIVLYNVFSGPERGPEIFGTEPWHFYIRNLLLNFNIWFVLAVASFPLFMLKKVFSKTPQEGGAVIGVRSIIFLSPFYLWLGIFSFQPHKEERFMYPAYPALALNAAMALHIILAAFGNTDPKTIIGKIPPKLKLFVVSSLLLVSFDLGVARIYGVISAYSAPLSIYRPLQDRLLASAGGDYICLGKEWYRFPSQYHLPKNMRAKFIKSEFKGLLPGEFSEAATGLGTGFGFWPGAYMIPSGMNDQNIEDMGKYIDLGSCHYLVDTYYPESNATELEPHYILDTENWEEVSCQPFLDASQTHILGRTIWLPEWPIIPEKYRRKWGKHCLLQRKPKV